MCKVSVIGCGYWGKNLIRVFNELGFLDSVCDTNKDNINNIVKKFNVREKSFNDILNDEKIKGIVISTPPETHANLAMEALNKGKHVFVEKPLSLNTEQAEKLVKIASHKQLVLMVGHLLQYHPAFLRLKQYISEGELGRLQYIYSNRLNFGKLRKEENILWSFAPHDISMILSLVGEEPIGIDANGAYYINENICDVTTTHMQFSNNINAHIFVSWLHPHKEQKLIVIGANGMAVFDDQLPNEKKLAIYPHKVGWNNGAPVANKSELEYLEYTYSEPLKNECQHFIDCIDKGITCKTGGYEGLKVLKVLSQAQKSLDNKT